jgi:hypothetical protein
MVKTHFILLVKEIKSHHDENLKVLKQMQADKIKETENLR